MNHDPCVSCKAALACVAGVARYAYRCHICKKVVVRVHLRTIEIGDEKPDDCKLGGLKDDRARGWPGECTNCFLGKRKEGYY